MNNYPWWTVFYIQIVCAGMNPVLLIYQKIMALVLTSIII